MCRTLPELMLVNNLVSTFTVCAVIQGKVHILYRKVLLVVPLVFLWFMLCISTALDYSFLVFTKDCKCLKSILRFF